MGDVKVIKTAIAGTAGYSYAYEVTDKDGKVTDKGIFNDLDDKGLDSHDYWSPEKGTMTTSIFGEIVKQTGTDYRTVDEVKENPATGEKYEDLDPTKGFVKGHKYNLGSVAKALDYGKTSSNNVSASSITNPFSNLAFQGGGLPMCFGGGLTGFSSLNVDYNMLQSVMSQYTGLISGALLSPYMNDSMFPDLYMPSLAMNAHRDTSNCFSLNNTILPAQNLPITTNDKSIISSDAKDNTKDKTIGENTDDKKLKGNKSDKDNEIKDSKNDELNEEVDEALDEQAYEICNMIYKATDGVGTDDDKLEAAIGEIKPENVLRVMEVWKESFAKKAGKKSLIQVINGDTEHDPSWTSLISVGTAFLPKDNQEYILPIKEAMLLKAKDMKANLSKEKRKEFNNAIYDFDTGVDDQYKPRNRWGGLFGGWFQDGEKVNAAFENLFNTMESQKNKKGKTTKKETTEETNEKTEKNTFTWTAR